ncbi:hypothetical protein HanPI659440_Chr10g0384611 [Helianthus annuus]|nr:hypothetical protein HanHA300_Chr10g0367971 [Helianthus annuus]KAJ0697292.1 hypothetical protein HanLR1_Chr10g0367351 [Helianthus annuus]KAJ0744174.1 hypothetical protein HanPI659440_Chr10g0384611 [Helianthus annuus]
MDVHGMGRGIGYSKRCLCGRRGGRIHMGTTCGGKHGVQGRRHVFNRVTS